MTDSSTAMPTNETSSYTDYTTSFDMFTTIDIWSERIGTTANEIAVAQADKTQESTSAGPNVFSDGRSKGVDDNFGSVINDAAYPRNSDEALSTISSSTAAIPADKALASKHTNYSKNSNMLTTTGIGTAPISKISEVNTIAYAEQAHESPTKRQITLGNEMPKDADDDSSDRAEDIATSPGKLAESALMNSDGAAVSTFEATITNDIEYSSNVNVFVATDMENDSTSTISQQEKITSATERRTDEPTSPEQHLLEDNDQGGTYFATVPAITIYIFLLGAILLIALRKKN